MADVIIANARFYKTVTVFKDSDRGVSSYTVRDKTDFPEGSAEKKGCLFYFSAIGQKLPDMPGMLCDLCGEWKKSKYGWQFAVRTYSLKEPTAEEDIEAFFASGAVKGIGPMKAKKIVERFGKDAFRIFSETPERFLEIRGIYEKNIVAMKNSMSLKTGYLNLAALMMAAGFATEKVTDAYKALGENACEQIKENPYSLMRVKGISFEACERQAAVLDFDPFSQERISAAITCALRRLSAENGDMFSSRKTMLEKAYEILGAGIKLVPKDYIHEAYVIERNAGTVREYFPESYQAVFLKEYDAIEQNIAEKVCTLASEKKSDKNFVKSFSKWKERAEFNLTEGQEKAVTAVSETCLLIITGGPGTGKTTVAKAVIDSFTEAHPEKAITCLAPTGKAARRLSEATGCYACTIHSALKMESGNGLLFYKEKLPEGLVIVDEFSMVDSFVADALFQAVGENTTVVILGDPDQLPSVGAGSVLAELIRSGSVEVATLTEVMRQSEGNPIIANCHLVNEGRTALTFNETFRFVPATKDNAAETVLALYMQEVQRNGMENVCILSPLKKWGSVSVKELNVAVQNMLPLEGEGVICHGTCFHKGDRVLQTKNNDFASNGDVGVILLIRTESGEDEKSYRTVFTIVFENGVSVKYDKKEMEGVELAYALTIHKSQGSEYKSVIIPLLSRYKCPLYKRNLLYTALSRAKERVAIVGDLNAVYDCIGTVDTGTRKTLLANRIYGLMQKRQTA